MTRTPVGVLVMAHGTPASPEGIEPFYTAIRRGRPPTPELLDELVGRYRAIGGTSPLDRADPGAGGGAGRRPRGHGRPGEFVVRYGAKYARPTIEEGVAALADAGVDRMVGIVLTPHQSSLGSGEYFRRAEAAAASAEPALELTAVPSWHRAEGFASPAGRPDRGLPGRPVGRRAPPGGGVLHRPQPPPPGGGRGRPVPRPGGRSAADVAARLGLDAEPGLSWGVAWQSAGRTADPWIGPDLLDEIRRVAGEGATAVVVCPVGFVSDHLEILYDLDIEADQVARSAGVRLRPDPVAQRRSPLPRHPGRAWSAGPRRAT